MNERFLTGVQLHETLLINTLPNNLIYETNKTNCLNKQDFYLVNFKIILNKDNKNEYKSILIYYCLSYSDIFVDIFLIYLITNHRFLESITFDQYGNFFTFIKNSIGSDNKLITEIKTSPNKYNELLNYKVEIKNMYQFLDDLNYSKKFVIILDIMYKYNLLFSLQNKDYKYFIYSFLYSIKVLDNIDFNLYERNTNIYKY